MQDLIGAILTRIQKCPKVKLAKLVLFVEREYYKLYLESPTGSYYVRKEMGPVPANYNEILNSGKGTLWSVDYIPFDNCPDDGQTYHQYSPLADKAVDARLQEIVERVVDTYGKYPGTRLSEQSHMLPAWRYAEPGEPIFIEELAVDTDEQYWYLQDTVAEMDDDDDDVCEDIPSKLS